MNERTVNTLITPLDKQHQMCIQNLTVKIH